VSNGDGAQLQLGNVSGQSCTEQGFARQTTCPDYYNGDVHCVFSEQVLLNECPYFAQALFAVRAYGPSLMTRQVKEIGIRAYAPTGVFRSLRHVIRFLPDPAILIRFLLRGTFLTVEDPGFDEIRLEENLICCNVENDTPSLSVRFLA